MTYAEWIKGNRAANGQVEISWRRVIIGHGSSSLRREEFSISTVLPSCHMCWTLG